MKPPRIYFSRLGATIHQGVFEGLNRDLRIRNIINLSTFEKDEVVRFDDEQGREYCWDGTELYRMVPLKGRFGRKKKND